MNALTVASPSSVHAPGVRMLHVVSSDATLGATGIAPQLCKSLGFDHDALRAWSSVPATRIRVRKGTSAFHRGDRATSLYVVRAGSFKTVVAADEGVEQVAGFHVAGDILAAQALGSDTHDACAVALEDSELCVIPVDTLRELAAADLSLQRALHRMLAHEIARSRQLAAVLATMRAEQRLAWFIVDVARRYQALGYSSIEFLLRMTREEIGTYLGLTLETVSRLFSRFHRLGLIDVHGRTVRLVDRAGLQRLLIIEPGSD